MLVLGAGGHAKEVLDILEREYTETSIIFFDSTLGASSMFQDEYKIVPSFVNILESKFVLRHLPQQAFPLH